MICGWKNEEALAIINERQARKMRAKDEAIQSLRKRVRLLEEEKRKRKAEDDVEDDDGDGDTVPATGHNNVEDVQ